MADPDPATAPDPNPAPPPLPLDAFTCPVCLELMYKPTIASPCAHAACFWCAHRAMNSFSPSSCPLCRSVFCHQAAVCAPLHRFIQASFPAEAAAREAEVLAEEAGSGVASMEVVAADGKEGPLSPGAWACAAPACGRLVARPTALLCGHVVCAACVPTGRACPACGRVARAVGGGSDAAAPHPPHPPRPCPLLAGVVGGLFPGAYAARCAGDGGGGGEGGGGGPGAAPAAPSPPPPAAPPLPAAEAAAATATPPPSLTPPPLRLGHPRLLLAAPSPTSASAATRAGPTPFRAPAGSARTARRPSDSMCAASAWRAGRAGGRAALPRRTRRPTAWLRCRPCGACCTCSRTRTRR